MLFFTDSYYKVWTGLASVAALASYFMLMAASYHLKYCVLSGPELQRLVIPLYVIICFENML